MNETSPRGPVEGIQLPKKVPGEVNPIDIHVGQKLRQRRTLMGMSQGKLGQVVGLTFQQIQKYERGANRIGASRLFDLSRILNVSIAYFFEGIPREFLEERYGKENFMDLDHTDISESSEDINRRETLELVRNYYKISNPTVRKRLFDLAKVLGQESGDDF